MRAPSPMLVQGVDKSRFASFVRGDLITDKYCDLQKELHARPKGYGGKGDKWADGVRQLVARFDCTSVLDYGCGQGSLVKALSVNKPSWLRLAEFDWAVDGKDYMPTFADLVTCTDVLEHIEPSKLDAVLGHLHMLARKAVFVVIATRESNKTLADGRNAHLILEDATWWADKVECAGFTIQPDPPKSPLAKPSREWVAVLT